MGCAERGLVVGGGVIAEGVGGVGKAGGGWGGGGGGGGGVRYGLSDTQCSLRVPCEAASRAPQTAPKLLVLIPETPGEFYWAARAPNTLSDVKNVAVI